MRPKFALFKYDFKNLPNIKITNIGDYIQSIAARQFLPQVDLYIDREELNSDLDSDYNCIMNGWYLHSKNWPPTNKINPLFVSFHINSSAEDVVLSQEGIEYLKKHQPIGCRDKRTRDLLVNKGVDAYFSGCLTLTLGKTYKNDLDNSKGIYLVDPYYEETFADKVMRKLGFEKSVSSKKNAFINHVSGLFDKKLLKNAPYIEHQMKAGTMSNEEAFIKADELLNLYKNAELVITSRIHCALPCLAMGTPVIYVYNCNDHIINDCRMDGLLDLFNVIYINKGKVTANFDTKKPIRNKTNHVELAEKLKETVNSFILNAK